MEAVLTNGVDFAVGKESFYPTSRKEKIKDKHIYMVYILCSQILFQLINEDFSRLFVNCKYFFSITNERFESNQLQLE